ncbi:MAG TPA: universal stress protein [Jatrophihabitans sp.]|nr:universal stress protein [Jatrophihabitans sp.]
MPGSEVRDPAEVIEPSDVVVGIDGSATAAHALDWAAAEAGRRGVRLVVVYANEVVDSAAYSTATLRAMQRDSLAHGSELLGHAGLTVAAKHPDLSMTTLLRQQRPSDALLDLARLADLVVVGTHGGHRLTGALLGSVSQRVAAHAVCTAVVVGSDVRQLAPRYGILAGVSDSPGGRAALRFACEEAARTGAPVTAMRAYGVFSRTAHNQLYGPLLGLRRHEADLLDGIVEWLTGEYPGVRVEPALVEENPTDALARASRSADLLVLGCRHSDDHWPSRLGPVTAALLHHSACPLAVVGVPNQQLDQPVTDRPGSVRTGAKR